jgi:hypothetical protein
VDDRPTIWTSDLNNVAISRADRFPDPIGSTSSPWTVDLAHQGSLAYIPYLITGDLYYLEEMHFWACFDLGASNYSYRGGTQCWLVDQLRGNAWAFRNIVDAAAMTPPEMPEKAYLEEKILNNVNRWNNGWIVNGQLAGGFPTVRYIYTSGIDASLDPAVCSAGMSSWQTDYMTWSLVHAYQMGYPALDLVHWSGQGLIDRFGDWPGWNRYRGTTYVFPARGRDAQDNSAPFATWADVNSAFVSQPGPASYTGEGPDSYVFTSRGVMALVADLPNGLANWNWLDTAVAAFKGGLPYDTRWAFVPPAHLTGDVNKSGHVDVSDLLVLAGSWGRSFGVTGYNPTCDLNADFGIDVADLLALAQTFGQ